MSNERRARGLYWDKAWKLVEGCTKVSPGCDNCWSEAETAMRSGHPNQKICERALEVVTFPDDLGEGLRFDGSILLRHDNLELPIRIKKPTVFAIWNDLYHEDVPDAFRDRVYGMMASNHQHTYLILTKRADRMADYWAGLERDKNLPSPKPGWHSLHGFRIGQYGRWCYEKIWHGVTAENQQTADERNPRLLRVPGKHFLSIEPMLGPVIVWPYFDSVRKRHWSGYEGIHAVLLGGESGKNARPMHPDWVRSVRDQCAEAEIPFTLKQWGEWAPNCLCGRSKVCKTIKRPEGLPGVMFRCGKKAGRTLDEVIHNDLPWDQKGESQCQE